MLLGWVLGPFWRGPWGSPLVWLHRVRVLWSPLRVPLGTLGWFLGVPARLAAQGVCFVASWHCAGAQAARLAAQGGRFRSGTHEKL